MNDIQPYILALNALGGMLLLVIGFVLNTARADIARLRERDDELVRWVNELQTSLLVPRSEFTEHARREEEKMVETNAKLEDVQKKLHRIELMLARHIAATTGREDTGPGALSLEKT